MELIGILVLVAGGILGTLALAALISENLPAKDVKPDCKVYQFPGSKE